MSSEPMYVVKRGRPGEPEKREAVRFDAITERNELLTHAGFGGRDLAYARARLTSITHEVVMRFRSGMTTRELDALTAEVCADRSGRHTDYSDLAARIVSSDLQKSTPPTFEGAVAALHAANPRRLSREFRAVVARAGRAIEKRVRYARDFNFTRFGIAEMQRKYLFRARDRDTPIVERPQHTYMRVAIQCCILQGEKAASAEGAAALPAAEFNQLLERTFHIYDLLSTHKLSHASPTFFNAGTSRPQLASCFLLATDDSLVVLTETIKSIVLVSAAAGGIGLSLDPMRAENSLIRSTGGQSTGIRYYIGLIEAARQYANQGNLRKGAIAVSLSPHHADVPTFLEMGRLTNYGLTNAPNLKYALWISDLFMEATVAELRAGPAAAATSSAGDWHLFSPDEAPGLYKCHGDEFRALHAKYVREKRYRRVVKTSFIWAEWFRTVAQRGNPYIMFKDNICRKSNLIHVQTPTHANLCTEIFIPAVHAEGEPEKAETGVCILAALPLAGYVLPDVRAPSGHRFDWAAFIAAAGEAAENLDNNTSSNAYPTAACRRSSERHRPIGIGIMGLADVLEAFGYPYGDPAALALDRAIHAAMYYGAMVRSVALGKSRGNFPSFEGSGTQRGKLQPDLWVDCGHLQPGWEAAVEETTGGAIPAGAWAALRAAARVHLRNAFVTADMPTATTSQVVGQNEGGEPRTRNVYTRSTDAGEFTVVNRHMQGEFTELDIWDDQMHDDLIASGGSVQGFGRVPAHLQRLYRTARELPQEALVDHAAAGGAFLTQSKSLNLQYEKLTLRGVLTTLIRAWKMGLTTGSYYIHSTPAGGTAGGAKKPAEGAAGAAKKPEAAAPKFDFAAGLCDGCGV